MTIVLDSGAFIAIEKNNGRFNAFITAARNKLTTIVVPAAVVAETWRGTPKSAQAARFMKLINYYVDLTMGAARETGELLAKSRSSTVIDANVVSIAIAMRPSTIVTSDPYDIERLLQNANVTYVHDDASSEPKVDVTIVAV